MTDVEGRTPESSALLRDSPSIDAFLFDILDSPTQTTLKRCAVVRAFDEALYEQILRPSDGPELTYLLDQALIEPTTDDHDSYAVADLLDVAYSTFWSAEDRAAIVSPPLPDELRILAGRCARWFADHDEPLAQLDALLQCDLEEAGRRLRELYTQADDEHDLAACHDLLDVLERPDRIPLYVGSSLSELHAECRARLAARTRWASAYSASAQYFARPVLEQHLEKALAAESTKVLQLFARGGMGKTMQLRWFLGRRCASGPEHVPAASIDFDHEDASRAAGNPWLVALRIAEQLEAQLVGDHFRAVLQSHGAFIPLLYEEVQLASGPLPPMPNDIDGRDVVSRIAAILAERPADKPVVVVVDTCEELLRPGIEPGEFFEMLAELARSIPALRLVLAGRHDLTMSEALHMRGCNIAQLFPSIATLRVPPFEKAERRRYLVELRKLPAGELVDVIVERAGESPFQLAIFADLARLDPDITAAKLRTTEEPGMLYLIERILKRVEDDVRWLLVYGVVPRRLSLAFLRDVMWDFLKVGMRRMQEEGAAEPALESLPLTASPPPESDDDITRLWERMLGHASKYSWVWVDEDGDLRFHPDVLEPLRTLARRGSEFYRPLHRRAIAYFDNLAATDQDRWGVWTAEVLYHRFQLDGSDAASYWREALDHAWTTGSSEAVSTIAREPLRREYLDEDDLPRVLDGRRIVPWELVVAAHVALALVAADGAGRISPVLTARRTPAVTRRWLQVERHLRAAREIATVQGVAPPQPETDLAEARAAIATGKIGRAAELISMIDPGSASPTLRLMIELTQRFVRQLRGDADPWTGFEDSWTQAVTTRQPRLAMRVALDRAEVAADKLQFGTALSWLAKASELDVTGGDDRRISMHADALVASGALAAAIELVREPHGPLSTVSLVQAYLAADRPNDGLATANDALAALVTTTDSELCSKLYQLRSAAHARLLHVDDAYADLYGAKAAARRLHDPSLEAAAAAQLCRLHLREIGDLRNAAACLDDAQDAEAPEGSPGWLVTQLVRAEWEASSGNGSAALETLAHARALVSADADHIQLSVAELVSYPAAADAARKLVDQLAAVEPPSARLMLIDDLALVDALTDPVVDIRTLRVAAADALTGSNKNDRAALAWRYAELHRVAGDVAEGRRLIMDHVVPAADANPFLWWRAIDGLRRCGPASRDDVIPPEDPFRHYEATHALRAAWLLRLVQWRGHLEATTWCQRKLDEATSLLQRPQTLPTRWRAELDETRATVDQRVGGSKEQARTAAATASAVWARLGQPRRRAKIADSYELGVAEPGADQDVELRMWFGEGGFDSADVYAEVAAEGMSEPVDRIGHVVVFGELATQMHDSSARLRHISRLIAFEWERWATGVGGSLAVSTLSEALQQYEGGLRLVTGQAELAAMPWESLSPPHFNGQTLSHALQPRLVYRCVDVSQRQEREVTAAQAALGRLGFFTARIDGLVGAATRAAVSQFQRTCGLRSSGTLTSDTWHQLRAHVVAAAAERPLRVLIVAPSNGRGKTDLSALAELTALYANRGASVQTIELADLLRAGRALAGASEERPDVVHVLATVDLVGGNVVIESSAELDLGRTGSFGLDQLSVTVLGDFLATVSREGFGPAIVIETPWRPSRAEAARSLLLRNVLGQSLLTLGRTEAILCTGGASPKRRRSHREIIAEALVERCDLGQVSARLQLGAGWGSGLEDAVSRLGSALFLERSPHTLFPVGTG